MSRGSSGQGDLRPLKLSSGRHLVGREPPAKKTKLEQSSAPFCQLDDPVLDGIKCHLAIGSRIGFEPISRRFTRIAFFIRDRMKMKLAHVQYQYELPEKSSLQLVVKRQNGVFGSRFDIAISDMEVALHSLVLHIHKWRSVVVSHSFLYDWMNDQIINFLLDAILAESRPVIDIRRFSCRQLTNQHQEKLAEFIQRGAQFLHSPSIGLHKEIPLPVVMQSIGFCHGLRHLAIDSWAKAEQFPPSFLSMVLGLENLNAFHFGVCHSERLETGHLSLATPWLPFFAQSAFSSLLQKMHHFNVKVIGVNVVPVAAALTQILAEMRSPAHVVVTSENKILTWQRIWSDFLPLIHLSRANILVSLLPWGLLPKLTSEEFATGLSTLPACVQSGLISPDLQNAPVDDYYNRYLELVFRFSNGGQLTVKRCYCPIRRRQ